jgi:ATP-dependent HslUV protease subunit HslV
MMIATDATRTFLLSGNGDVIEPDEGVISIGSGSVSAQSAATALMRHTDFTAAKIVAEAMKIASSLCIYTNDVVTIEEL